MRMGVEWLKNNACPPECTSDILWAEIHGQTLQIWRLCWQLLASWKCIQPTCLRTDRGSGQLSEIGSFFFFFPTLLLVDHMYGKDSNHSVKELNSASSPPLPGPCSHLWSLLNLSRRLWTGGWGRKAEGPGP